MQGMLPFVIAGLAAGAVLLIAVGIAMSGGSGGVASRLERYASGRGDGPSGTDGTIDRESAITAGLNRVIERQGLASRLSTDLARADLKLRPAEFAAAWIVTPFVFVGIGFLLSILLQNEALRNPVALALLFLLGAFAPRFYLRYRQGKRLKTFSEQLPDTITLLANSLRAGSSFLQGVELVSREARPPISEEFERVVREMNLGVALQPALNNLVRRVASEDLELMVTAINIQSQVGGNLATVLDSIAFTIRERVRIQGEIRTLTAMQRYSGYVITLLPVGLGLILFVISPTYFGRMFEPEPAIFGLPAGVIFLIIGAISMFFGYVLIRRIVDIKV
jgi:tight adherence protein B